MKVFVCLFKRPGSIPNDSISIWNASLSLKQANKHSKIKKNKTIPFFVYPTLKKLQRCKNSKSDRKRRKCGWCLRNWLDLCQKSISTSFRVRAGPLSWLNYTTWFECCTTKVVLRPFEFWTNQMYQLFTPKIPVLKWFGDLGVWYY